VARYRIFLSLCIISTVRWYRNSFKRRLRMRFEYKCAQGWFSIGRVSRLPDVEQDSYSQYRLNSHLKLANIVSSVNNLKSIGKIVLDSRHGHKFFDVALYKWHDTDKYWDTIKVFSDSPETQPLESH
jgi:hypothetical protein